MEIRLVLTLHLDAFNMAQGGGFTTYNLHGKKVASMAWPQLPGGERTLEDAVALLTRYYLVYQETYGHQLGLPGVD